MKKLSEIRNTLKNTYFTRIEMIGFTLIFISLSGFIAIGLIALISYNLSNIKGLAKQAPLSLVESGCY